MSAIREGWAPIAQSTLAHYFRPHGDKWKSVCSRFIFPEAPAGMSQREPVPEADCKACRNGYRGAARRLEAKAKKKRCDSCGGEHPGGELLAIIVGYHSLFICRRCAGEITGQISVQYHGGAKTHAELREWEREREAAVKRGAAPTPAEPPGALEQACKCGHQRSDHFHSRAHCLASVQRTGKLGGAINCSCLRFDLEF